MTYKHKEAFCLMHYRCEDCGCSQIIWNSRDGVTPFGCSCPHCKGINMTHVDWQMDECKPDHMPSPGDRIFMDLTPARRARHAEQMIKRYWDDEKTPMSRQWKTRDEALAALLEAPHNEGEPMSAIVGDVLWPDPKETES